jgi:hypothetical protein
MNHPIAQPRFYFPPNLVQFFKPRPFSKNIGYNEKKRIFKILTFRKKKIQLRKYIKSVFLEKSSNKINFMKKKKEFKLIYNISIGRRNEYFLVTNLIPDFLGKKLLTNEKKYKEKTKKIYFSINIYNWISFWGLFFLKLNLTINTIKKEIKFFAEEIFPFAI